jgi:hypothetical protein
LQCNGYKLSNVIVNDAFEGITVQGGQFGSLKCFSVFASAGSYAGANTALLHFRQAPYSSGPTLYQSCYTVNVEDYRLSAGLLRDGCIRIANGDGLSFGQGYIANALNANVIVKAERDSSYVAVTTFTNSYLDCVSAGRTKNGVDIRADGFASSFVYMLKFVGCAIGNGDERGILCRKPETLELTVDGTSIINMGLWAIDVEGSTSYTDLQVAGSKLQNCGDATSGAIRASTGRSLNLSGNTFSSNETACLAVAGTWTRGLIVGNSNNSSIKDIDNTATFTNPLNMSGNNTAWAGAYANSWDPAGSWTPVVTYGGASVGVTYTTQQGRYEKIGRRLFFSLYVQLSSKGSSTGNMSITGLPVASAASGVLTSHSISVIANSVGATVGDTALSADIAAGSTGVRAFKEVAGFATQLTDADCTNTSRFIITGHYETA